MDKVLVLLFPTFAEFELTIATDVLRDTHEIVTIAASLEPITGEAGLRCLPHLTIAEVDPADYVGILIPGGADMFAAKALPGLSELINNLHAQGKLIGAICGGPYVLGQAGLLSQYPYTTSFYQEHRDFLGVFNEENFRDEPLVEAGNVITAVGWAYAEFGLLFAERLGVELPEGKTRFFLGGHSRFSTNLRKGLHCSL